MEDGEVQREQGDGCAGDSAVDGVGCEKGGEERVVWQGPQQRRGFVVVVVVVISGGAAAGWRRRRVGEALVEHAENQARVGVDVSSDGEERDAAVFDA